MKGSSLKKCAGQLRPPRRWSFNLLAPGDERSERSQLSENVALGKVRFYTTSDWERAFASQGPRVAGKPRPRPAKALCAPASFPLPFPVFFWCAVQPKSPLAGAVLLGLRPTDSQLRKHVVGVFRAPGFAPIILSVNQNPDCLRQIHCPGGAQGLKHLELLQFQPETYDCRFT